MSPSPGSVKANALHSGSSAHLCSQASLRFSHSYPERTSKFHVRSHSGVSKHVLRVTSLFHTKMAFEYSLGPPVANEELAQFGFTSIEGPYTHSAAFPSPHTWKASRHTEFSLPSDCSSGSEVESGSDAGAGIAEWMAHTCISEEDEQVEFSIPRNPPRHHSILEPLYHPHLAAIRTRPVYRNLPATSSSILSPSLSWSSSECFSEASASVTGSPTSVIGQAESAAWDVLFAAAGEVQQMAREREAEHGSFGHKSVQQLLLNRNAGSNTRGGSSKACTGIPSNLRKPFSGADSPLSRSRRDNTSSSSPSPSSYGSPPSRENSRTGAGFQAASLGGGSSSGGTGVFLPRAAPEQNSKKKASRQTTIILPPHLVQALGLNVDCNNNVVLSANQRRTGGNKASAIQVIKVADAPTRPHRSHPRKAVVIQPRPSSTWHDAPVKIEAKPAQVDLSAAWTY